jgi:hypothetical protein
MFSAAPSFGGCFFIWTKHNLCVIILVLCYLNKEVNMNNNQQNNIRVNLDDASDVICEKCENNYFSQVVMIKKISALVSPTGQEAMVPVQLFQCNKCGHVNQEFLPGN